MRSVIVSNIMSLDGYYEGPGGNVMVLPMDAAFDAYNLERIEQAGTVLLGRRSYELFSSHWPGIADAPDDPAAGRAHSDTNRALSRIYNRLEKVVVTDTYTPERDNPWYDTTTVIGRGQVRSWLTDVRQDGDTDIVVFGSRTMWNGLLADGLVDEVHLMVGATVLGDGTPTFDAPVPALRLLESRPFDGSDNVLLRFAPGAG